MSLGATRFCVIGHCRPVQQSRPWVNYSKWLVWMQASLAGIRQDAGDFAIHYISRFIFHKHRGIGLWDHLLLWPNTGTNHWRPACCIFNDGHVLAVVATFPTLPVSDSGFWRQTHVASRVAADSTIIKLLFTANTSQHFPKSTVIQTQHFWYRRRFYSTNLQPTAKAPEKCTLLTQKRFSWAERCNHSWLWLAQWDEMDMVDIFQRAACGLQVVDFVWYMPRAREAFQVILPGLLFAGPGKATT